MSYCLDVMSVVLERVVIVPEPIRRTTRQPKPRKRAPRAAWRDDGDPWQR